VSEAAGSAAAAGTAAAKQPLDDVMLAMDVVDTLRRKKRLVERELDEYGREEDLKERLRKIYAAQGIEVSNAILEEGVQALKEDRFRYRPPPDSLGVRLAQLYVSRRTWGKWLLGALATIAIMVAGWQYLVVGPRNALPRELKAVHAEVVDLAKEQSADARADNLLATAQQAIRDGDTDDAQAALTQMQRMRAQLASSYRIQVVNRPGERSGVFRIPDINPSARNYYVIVEAIGPDGRSVAVPVQNEETGKIEQVKQWGLRVDEPTYNRIAADKRDDGIIQNDIMGHKEPGYLNPSYDVNTNGAAITQW